jgi:hypothetical protein
MYTRGANLDKKIKNILAIVVFVIVSFYCMITGWWIFWAVIVSMIYIDALVDSVRQWLDARQERYLEAMKTIQMSSSENTATIQSIRQSVLSIEQRLNALELEK